MSDFKFINYVPVTGEKHLGVCSIMAYGKIMLRYKIVPGKDGTGFFASPPALKIDGEQYLPSFIFDSNFSKEEIEQLIRANVRPFHNQNQNSAATQYAPQQQHAQHAQMQQGSGSRAQSANIQWQQPINQQVNQAQNYVDDGSLPF